MTDSDGQIVSGRKLPASYQQVTSKLDAKQRQNAGIDLV
nr:MAG TPA: Sensor histidine kinase (AbfS) sensor domain [Caudoviricetes sp.]